MAKKLPSTKEQKEIELTQRKLEKIKMKCSRRRNAMLWWDFQNAYDCLMFLKTKGVSYGKAQEKLAEILDISKGQAGKMQALENKALAKIKEAIGNGEISINTAFVFTVKLDTATQQRVIAETPISEITISLVEQIANG